MPLFFAPDVAVVMLRGYLNKPAIAPRSFTAMTHCGRILLASLFILGGANKVLTFDQTLDRMVEVGLVPAEILLPITIMLEIVAGALVAIGRKLAKPAALCLAVFTLATNYYFHDFWMYSGQIRALELSLFFKNIAVAGGLLIVVGGISPTTAR